MRMIAGSIVVLAGSIVGGAGFIGASITHRLDGGPAILGCLSGLGLAVIGLGILAVRLREVK